MTKHTKRCKPVMTAIAVWMLLAHAVDVYLLIMPTVPAEALANASDWADFAAGARSGSIDVGYHPQLTDLCFSLDSLASWSAESVVL